MSVASLLAKTDRDRILEDSIEKGRQVVMTHSQDDGWRAYRSHFIAGSATSGVMMVAKPVPRDEVTITLPSVGDSLGVTFRLGHKKCIFGTVIAQQPDLSKTELVALRWPDHLQQLQRRAFERACPPRDQVVPVRLWIESSTSNAPLESRALRYGQLEDLSAGGMRVKVADPGEFTLGSTYRCAFSTRKGKPAFVLDALMRHREAGEQGRSSIGFQFVGLESTAEGRKTLERLGKTVNQFQRARKS